MKVQKTLKGDYYDKKNSDEWKIGYCHHDSLNVVKEFFGKDLSNKSAIDVGSGNGDFLLALRNLGFSNLNAVDFDNFLRDKSINFLKKDLDNDWNINNQYDLVTLKEVIEHLENTRKTIREIKNILKQDGICILTFPNIFYWRGRIKYLFGNWIYGFDEDDYRLSGHINPVTYYDIKRICKDNDLRCEIRFKKNKFLSKGVLAIIRK